MSKLIMDCFSKLSEHIDQKTATVGVIGLGYVGLPLVDAFIKAGFATLGFDLDEKKINSLANATSYIAHVPSTKIRGWLDQKKFAATSDMRRLAEPDVILICVPTPLSDSRDPDLGYVIATAEEIARVLRPGQSLARQATYYSAAPNPPPPGVWISSVSPAAALK